MNAFARQQQILAFVREKGMVQAQWLADHFGVTVQTIRRDIDQLASGSAVRRYRGGIAAPSSIENVDYASRKILMAGEKQRIAQAVAREVPDGVSLFINIGTTTEAVAQALFDHKGLRVITNNLNVATLLHNNTNFSVSIAGGNVRSRDGGIVGEATIDFIRQFKVDIGIIGISGIDTEGDLLDYDYQEVRVARSIIENSRKVYLVTDHTKFGRNAFVRLGHLSEVNGLFTDQAPPAEMQDVVAASGCAVHVA
ncbi:MAG TPA: DeoR family transcriptional regulator [Alphaproteobacteria bacterium]|nr:DeoR family transcriptional regulator [Alphaproteobacteria bacterium]